MKKSVFVLLTTLAVYPVGLLAEEEDFREVECGEFHRADFYRIGLRADDGRNKELVFNNKAKSGILTFHSTTFEFGKWGSELSSFDDLRFDQVKPGFGMLSIKRKDREQRYEFGLVSAACWDGLRRHVDGLIRTKDGP